jgi:hypothetical protein
MRFIIYTFDKFFTSNVSAEICLLQSKKTVFLFKKFDEMTRSFDLMK